MASHVRRWIREASTHLELREARLIERAGLHRIGRACCCPCDFRDPLVSSGDAETGPVHTTVAL
jgi:hypothetical protein